MKSAWKWMAMVLVAVAVGCGSDADDALIGAECTSTSQCENAALTCMTQFKGGYCGASACTANADCPEKSICVTQGQTNYCFRTCEDKAECNKNRTVENESNCSSNITRVETGTAKVCIPPSSGS